MLTSGDNCGSIASRCVVPYLLPAAAPPALAHDAPDCVRAVRACLWAVRPASRSCRVAFSRSVFRSAMSTDGGGEEPRLVITFRIATHTHVHRRTHAGSGEGERQGLLFNILSQQTQQRLSTRRRHGYQARRKAPFQKTRRHFSFPALKLYPSTPPSHLPSIIIIIPTPTITLILPPTLPSSSLLSSPPSPHPSHQWVSQRLTEAARASSRSDKRRSLLASP